MKTRAIVATMMVVMACSASQKREEVRGAICAAQDLKKIETIIDGLGSIQDKIEALILVGVDISTCAKSLQTLRAKEKSP